LASLRQPSTSEGLSGFKQPALDATLLGKRPSAALINTFVSVSLRMVDGTVHFDEVTWVNFSAICLLFGSIASPKVKFARVYSWPQKTLVFAGS